jgi:hypothetical protein
MCCARPLRSTPRSFSAAENSGSSLPERAPT